MADYVNLRGIVYKGVKYLSTDDVVAYLRELAATEENDTRDRLNEAADNLLNEE